MPLCGSLECLSGPSKVFWDSTLGTTLMAFRLEEKLSNLESDNQVLHQQALTISATAKALYARPKTPILQAYCCLPVYKSLLQWRSFEVERTSVFDRIIQTIGAAIEVLRASPQSVGFTFLNGRVLGGLDDLRQVEAKYLALQYLILLVIVPVQVSPFLLRKVFTKIFSFINVQLFNRKSPFECECCSFSNEEFVKSGLAELENWCHEATEEYAGSAWDELRHMNEQFDSCFYIGLK
ncbi:Myosin-17 [Vitis vinifera]|uniref:Myosin-17 n=1 Tax=Vitis vinifera TaxID=29760 RepID=A0A438CIW0_VITVI|nr:Myosin-17 [Vitis vinifera]